jgi:hypothetical protein
MTYVSEYDPTGCSKSCHTGAKSATGALLESVEGVHAGPPSSGVITGASKPFFPTTKLATVV